MSAQTEIDTRDDLADRLESWVAFLRAHAAIARELSAGLQREHGLTLNDYEVLVHLSDVAGGRMRRVDLADSVMLTASGITRLLDGLEHAGFVRKESCADDRRVSYAKLAEAGEAKVLEAQRTYLGGVAELFLDRYSPSELRTLSELLLRLPVTRRGCAVRTCPQGQI